DGEELSAEEIETALRNGTLRGELSPILVGSGLSGAGAKALLDAMAHLIPSPAAAGATVAYGNNGEKVEVQPVETEPAAAPLFKTIGDAYEGRLSLLRVYSGAVAADSSLYNATKGEEERLGQIFVLRGKEQLPVPRLAAGEIGAVAKL